MRALVNSSKLLPGHLATLTGRRVGLTLVDVRKREYEVVAISTTEPWRGVGRALMERCFADARATGCRRVWLVTTNNNIAAIAFYQRMGMDLRALHRHAVAVSRELKPTIPERGAAGVRIDHELEFELRLETRPLARSPSAGTAECSVCVPIRALASHPDVDVRHYAACRPT